MPLKLPQALIAPPTFPTREPTEILSEQPPGRGGAGPDDDLLLFVPALSSLPSGNAAIGGNAPGFYLTTTSPSTLIGPVSSVPLPHWAMSR